jgi:phthalate 4,5-dioxygenase
MGQLMRRYWIPIIFSNRIEKPDSSPRRVRILCEDLIVFRDTEGRVGLVDEKCPHRTASLYFGRNEGAGIRCVYHGIKFDVHGDCMDVPCFPTGTTEQQLSSIKQNMRLKAYPCLERGGIVWAYMGPPDLKPGFPDLEWTRLPDEQLYVTRHIQECNWLQGVEGGYDAAHLTFLHGGTTDPSRRVVPSLYEVLPTDFGFIVGTGRDLGGANIHWNVNIFLMPFHKIISLVPQAAHMWVPIDDEHTMLYSINYNPDRPLKPEDLQRQTSWNGIHAENIPGTDGAVANKRNDYLIDRQRQASGQSFTGIKGIGIQDCAVQESMGPISDRTKEHLLPTDMAIAKIRRLLIDALADLAEGKTPPGLNPASFRVRSKRFEAPKDARFPAQDLRDLVRADA